MGRNTPSPTSEPFIPEHPHLQALNDAISSKALPCSSGVFAVQPEDLILYYGMKGPNSKGLGRIDFTAPADDEVEHLAESCDVATFGRGLQDVRDESYRKAGKLDRTQFCASFCPELSGLMDVIRHSILEGHSGKGLRLELYKLNVYGPGSFFKAHKDTPRAANNVASLVIVLPTSHQGGALVLRHEGRDFKFDSGELLSAVQVPSIAYAAFYGDIEHEVEPVTSGYRVTITYNLYLVDTAVTDVPQGTAYELALKDAFRALLQDRDYLPKGGLIGFGLRHEYPVDVVSLERDRRQEEQSGDEQSDDGQSDAEQSDEEQLEKQRSPDQQSESEPYGQEKPHPLSTLIGKLKGSDAVLQKVCADLGLRASLRIIYYDEYETVMCPAVLPFGDGPGENDSYASYVRRKMGAVKIEGERRRRRSVIHWATRKRPFDVRMVATPYVAYGNDAFMTLIYGTLCLVVEVGPAKSRTTAG